MARIDDDELDVVTKDTIVKHKHKHKHGHKHDYKMKYDKGAKYMHGSEGVNIFASSPMGTGAGMGGGYGHDGFGLGGGGILGGLLIGALLGRGGFGFGGGFGGGFDGFRHHGVDGCCEARRCATPDDILDIQALSKLGDIQAAIPLAEAQTQLALAGVQNNINQQTLEQTIALTQGQTAIQLAQANTMFQLGQQICGVNFNVEKTGWAVSQTVQNDGEKTRALIGSIDRENLNRQITVLANEVTELRHEHRRRDGEDGIRISMNNTSNQLQGQIQAQAQAQAIFNDRCFRELCEVSQLAKATNAQINIGSGTLTGAAQTANPINTRL
ncbi:hypothetical protein REA38_11580 [Serratia sp. MF2]|uniref:hypothetical protein n=1 Tax=Serratia sp. MF1(2023) TaxID=3059171 RepID=UPI0027FDADA3|nr:hypothetical protein [Serratia sp. MF1(2023)]MDQ7104190.1 hypothetical protein [Serratia sp. MF1(2023)]